MQGIESVEGVFFTLLHRITSSTCMALVGLMDAYTMAYITPMQGLCLGFLVFLVAEATDSATIKLRLFKRVCLLYCNQRIRSLFNVESTEIAAITNLFLAVCVAMVMMLTASLKSDDIQSLLATLTYLYGDILNFSLELYGVFKITATALLVSVCAEATVQPTNKVYAFCFNLIKIISANLVCEGCNMLMQADAVELEILECMAIVAVMRLFLPSMESYLTYMAARQLVYLMPAFSPFFACCLVFVILTASVPGSGKTWLGELAFNYIVIDTSIFLRNVTIQWAVFVVILLHYLDYIVTLRMGGAK